MLPVTFIHGKSESGDDYYFAVPGVLDQAAAEAHVNDYLDDYGSIDAGLVSVVHVLVYGA